MLSVVVIGQLSDHEVDSLHIKQDIDFEKFYEAYQAKHSKSDTTK